MFESKMESRLQGFIDVMQEKRTTCYDNSKSNHIAMIFQGKPQCLIPDELWNQLLR